MATNQWGLVLLLWVGACSSQVSVTGSSCAIMNRNMYITGGQVGRSQSFNNLINIDLTSPFSSKDFNIKNSSQVKFSSLGNQAPVPDHGALFGTATNGSRLWAFGSRGDLPQGLRYFDLSTGQWEPAVSANQGPTPRSAFAWSQYEGKQYVCGGNLTGTNTLTNEFWQLSASNLSNWKSMPTLDSIPAVQYHQATVVGESFVVLGGQLSDGSIRDLDEVWVFDFEKGEWRIQPTTGGKGIGMVKFTPVAYNDSIIIQGGANAVDTSDPNYKVYSELFILSTKNWAWRTIQLKTSSGQLADTARADYSAWVIGHQLVQFLGELNSTTSPQAQVISLWDFTVADTYTPPPDSWFNQVYTFPDQHNTGLTTGIIVVVVLAVVAVILLAIVLLLLYRRRVNRLEKEFAPAEPFLEPIAIPPTWSEANDQQRPISTSPSHPETKSSQLPLNDSGITGNSASPLNSNQTSQISTSPLRRAPTVNDPLFALRTDTFIPGDEEYNNQIINEKFVG